MSELSPELKLAAYFLGRRIAGQRRKQSSALVACLYNGDRMPPLPEGLDPAIYRHAFIYGVTGVTGTSRFLVFSSVPAVYCEEKDVSGLINIKSVSSNEVACQWCRYQLTDNAWVLKDKPEVSTFNLHASGGATWSNHDMLYKDGGTYLAASEPVPIYE